METMKLKDEELDQWLATTFGSTRKELRESVQNKVAEISGVAVEEPRLYVTLYREEGTTEPSTITFDFVFYARTPRVPTVQRYGLSWSFDLVVLPQIQIETRSCIDRQVIRRANEFYQDYVLVDRES